MISTLILHLSSPMQSWGSSSRFEHRGAGPAPSKSSICGMICAAIGAARQSPLAREIIEAFHRIRMTSVCINTGPILCDYHTVQGTRKANGSIDNKTAVQSYRHYWHDSRFIVLLNSKDEPLLRRMRQALLDPQWGIWLGRKSCIPSEPLIQEDIMPAADAQEHALHHIPENQRELFIEVEDHHTGTDTWQDEPLGFGSPAHSGRSGRAYGPRRINHIAALQVASEDYFQF